MQVLSNRPTPSPTVADPRELALKILEMDRQSAVFPCDSEVPQRHRVKEGEKLHPPRANSGENCGTVCEENPRRIYSENSLKSHSGFIHKMCGKLCENQFFDRSNSMKSDWLLPVCLNDVQADERRPPRAHSPISGGTENLAAKAERSNRNCSLRNDKTLPFPPAAGSYLPSTSATQNPEGVTAFGPVRASLCRVE